MEKQIKERILVIYIPVIHRGYIDLLKKLTSKIRETYIIGEEFISILNKHEPSIASLNAKEVKTLLNEMGFSNIKILTKNNINNIKKLPLLLIQDEVSYTLYNNYLKTKDIKWEKVFLRWDRKKVLSDNNTRSPISKSETDRKFMKEAYKEADRSSDWWRQIGAVLVKNGKIILRAYNKGLPDDHTPYKMGAVRDYLEVGEKPELSSTIHAEQMIVSEAAKRGISTKGTKIYVTHFPCSVCAKLIVQSGISYCFFSEGSSNTDGELVLKSAKVKISKVKIK